MVKYTIGTVRDGEVFTIFAIIVTIPCRNIMSVDNNNALCGL